MPLTPNSRTTSQISLTDTSFTEGLQSFITYRASGEKSFDGSRLSFYLADEAGKTEGVNIRRRHEIVARTMIPGIRIKGLMLYPSTVEELSSSVGKEFEEMSRDSMFEERGIDGRTKTGLITIYFNVMECYEGFIDPWGYAIIDNPTDPEVIANMTLVERNDDGEIMGVKEYLEKKEQKFIEDDDMVGLSSFQRKNPTSWRSCFASASFNLMFDRVKLQARLAELKYGKNNCIKGDFIEVDDFVRFVPKEDGPIIISKRLDPSQTNRRMFDPANSCYRPATGFDNVFVIAADPYKVSQTDSRRQSKGSMAVLYKHNPLVDDPDKDPREWSTKKFVCTMVDRPANLDLYCRKILLAARYFNAPVYPENNISVIQEYFERVGHQGYLLKDVDPKTGKLKINAGWTTGGNGRAKEELFSLVADYVDVFHRSIDHIEIIEELLSIPGPDKMKDFDLFVGLAGALRGERSSHIQRIRRFSQTKVDISGFYPK
jgi:hypothetical protein